MNPRLTIIIATIITVGAITGITEVIQDDIDLVKNSVFNKYMDYKEYNVGKYKCTAIIYKNGLLKALAKEYLYAQDQ